LRTRWPAERTWRCADLVLELRRQYRRQTGVHPDTSTWEQVIAQVGHAGTMLETVIADLVALARRVTRYEALLHAWGVLGVDPLVRRHGPRPRRQLRRTRGAAGGRGRPLRRAARPAGRAGRRAPRPRAVDSWPAFAAASILGHLLQRHDGETFDVFRRTALKPHALLMEDAASPWRTIPWHDDAVTAARSGP
jgi:hypothetical protein